MIGQIFALDSTSTARKNMLSMTLSGCISDTQLYIKEQWDPDHGTLGRLPPFIQDRIKTISASKSYDSPEYELLNEILTTKFTIRTAPFPTCFDEAFSGINVEIYAGMQGPSEFELAGVLADFNTTGRLHELENLPVLLTSGSYDTVRPKVAETMHQNLPVSERVLFRRSGHMTPIDEAGLMNNVVADFIERVENTKKDSAIFVPKVHDEIADDDGTGSESNASSSFALSTLMLAIIVPVAFGLVGFFFGRYSVRKDGGYEIIGETRVV